jgi:hypothetical protein
MLRAMLAVGGWALVGALIVFSADWIERERAFFSNGAIRWEHLE